MSEALKRKKPLDINPFRLSQPMGATLAFLGVKGCMPLMHGAQGCASFTKVFFTRHFNEPIAIQTTAVNDLTAVFDGGDVGVATAVENIAKKVTPSLIGLYSTGLTETKGDDLRGAASKIKNLPIVWVNTSDYEGGLQSGWAKSVTAMIEQLTMPKKGCEPLKAAFLPNVNLTPIEVEKFKEFLEDFGFSVVALPDLSTSLDGFLGEKQGALSSGGIEVAEIRELATSSLVITLGESMRECAEVLLAKNGKIVHLHFESASGLEATDEIAAKLCEFRGCAPAPRVQRWRLRLQDMMLDSHFNIGKAKFVVMGEPDFLYQFSKAVSEVGAHITAAVSTEQSALLQKIVADAVFVGDFADAEGYIAECDIVVSNWHAERYAKKYGNHHIVRGYPNFELIGAQLKNDILYEGSTYLLCEISNVLLH